jgi:hypothetical protein
MAERESRFSAPPCSGMALSGLVGSVVGQRKKRPPSLESTVVGRADFSNRSRDANDSREQATPPNPAPQSRDRNKREWTNDESRFAGGWLRGHSFILGIPRILACASGLDAIGRNANREARSALGGSMPAVRLCTVRELRSPVARKPRTQNWVQEYASSRTRQRSIRCQLQARSRTPARFSGCRTIGGGAASRHVLSNAGGTQLSRA